MWTLRIAGLQAQMGRGICGRYVLRGLILPITVGTRLSMRTSTLTGIRRQRLSRILMLGLATKAAEAGTRDALAIVATLL